MLVELEDAKAGWQVQAERARVESRAQDHALDDAFSGGTQDDVVVVARPQADVAGAVQVQRLGVGYRPARIRPLDEHRQAGVGRFEERTRKRILDQAVGTATLHRPRRGEAEGGHAGSR